MLFSSNLFLFGFLPFVLVVYFLFLAKAPLMWRNGFLFLASLFFYAWGEPIYVFLLLGVIFANWLFALWLTKARSLGLVIALCFNIGLLFSLKYVAFFIATLNQVTGWQLNVPEQTLPIGLSFFLFQAISYVVDVHRGLCQAAKNPCEVGLYLAFFPQLAAGPIVRYNSIAAQIKMRHHCWQDISAGLCRFLVGLGAKVLLADQLTDVVDKAFALAAGQRTDLAILMAWLGAIAFMLQIYFDFVGYSHMAIGLARVFGFYLPENFRQPYSASSITDFWRRWHISLSSWLRDYIYIPLGGSRVGGKSRLAFNLLIVWLVSGFWHGANWTYVLWGLFFYILLLIEKWSGFTAKMPTWLSRSYTLLAVLFSWILFRSENISSAIFYYKALFGLAGNAWTNDYAAFYSQEYGFYLVLAILFTTPFWAWLQNHLVKQKYLALVVVPCLLFIFFLTVSYLVKGSYNPFIYFQF